jgi:hypothetical protein
VIIEKTWYEGIENKYSKAAIQYAIGESSHGSLKLFLKLGKIAKKSITQDKITEYKGVVAKSQSRIAIMASAKQNQSSLS